MSNKMKFCRTCNVELIKGENWTTPKLLCRRHWSQYILKKYYENWERRRAVVTIYETKNNKTEKRKKQLNQIAKRMSKKYPKKHIARSRLKSAVKAGKIIRPNICDYINGSAVSCKGRIEAHHPDYNKPFEVIWLCKADHVYIHHKRNL